MFRVSEGPPEYHHVGRRLGEGRHEAGEAEQRHEGEQQPGAAAATGSWRGGAKPAHASAPSVVLTRRGRRGREVGEEREGGEKGEGGEVGHISSQKDADKLVVVPYYPTRELVVPHYPTRGLVVPY